MYLDVALAQLTVPTTSFVFTVPGHQQWKLRTVYAVAQTHVGGAPNRGYLLTISDGTTPVAVAAAADAGNEPATVNITWADVSAVAQTIGNIGVSDAPLPNLVLDAGYVITGTILHPAAGDTWQSATVWFDYVYTTGP